MLALGVVLPHLRGVAATACADPCMENWQGARKIFEFGAPTASCAASTFAGFPSCKHDSSKSEARFFQPCRLLDALVRPRQWHYVGASSKALRVHWDCVACRLDMAEVLELYGESARNTWASAKMPRRTAASFLCASCADMAASCWWPGWTTSCLKGSTLCAVSAQPARCWPGA